MASTLSVGWRGDPARWPGGRAGGTGGCVGLRASSEIGGTVCFLLALFNMPIAGASAILQSLPLAVTLAGRLSSANRSAGGATSPSPSAFSAW